VIPEPKWEANPRDKSRSKRGETWADFQKRRAAWAEAVEREKRLAEDPLADVHAKALEMDAERGKA
jgi:broad specificity phosphatase PhoE